MFLKTSEKKSKGCDPAGIRSRGVSGRVTERRESPFICERLRETVCFSIKETMRDAGVRFRPASGRNVAEGGSSEVLRSREER